MTVAVFQPSLTRRIQRLFAAGEQGVWFDPSDLTTLFQDSAGTTPAVVGQPVGKMLDKSGRGNHATQSTAAARPTLQQDVNGKYYLSFDGIDDALVTGNIDFTATDKMSVFAGLYAPTAVTAMVLEFGPNAPITDGSFYITDNESQSGPITVRTRGTTNAGGGYDTNAPPDLLVGTYQFDNAAVTTGQAKIRVNGIQKSLSWASSTSPGNYRNDKLYIGHRAGPALFFTGKVYCLIIRGALSDAAQITNAENYVNSKTGAY